MPDLTLQHDSPHPILEISQSLRRAWRDRQYPLVRIALLSLVSMLRNPHDERRCVVLLAAVAREFHDRKTEADAFYLLGALEEREWRFAQAAGDYLKARSLYLELGRKDDARECDEHIARLVATARETRAAA